MRTRERGVAGIALDNWGLILLRTPEQSRAQYHAIPQRGMEAEVLPTTWPFSGDAFSGVINPEHSTCLAPGLGKLPRYQEKPSGDQAERNFGHLMQETVSR